MKYYKILRKAIKRGKRWIKTEPDTQLLQSLGEKTAVGSGLIGGGQVDRAGHVAGLSINSTGTFSCLTRAEKKYTNDQVNETWRSDKVKFDAFKPELAMEQGTALSYLKAKNGGDCRF